ncbi:MAG TPA: hypothetical protein VI197_21965 [Polyangiaceae bacterium]
MRLCSIAKVFLGLFIGVGTSCGSTTSESGGDKGSGADTASNTQGGTQTSSAVSGSDAISSASTSAGDAATGTGGSSTSTASTSASASSATSTSISTSSGGSAGDVATATNTTSTGPGGSGGVPDDTCPSEPPVGNTPCKFFGGHCAYEDCAGSGRSVAVCPQGTWFVETSACSDMVYCSGGSEICAAGEVCLVMAGGAFLQECVPNTCEGQAVDCDCTEGCFGDCTTFASAQTGITITCNTCPEGNCP